MELIRTISNKGESLIGKRNQALLQKRTKLTTFFSFSWQWNWFMRNLEFHLEDSKAELLINPIPTERGPFGPEQPKTVWHFHSFMAGVTKIYDFVYFSICLVPVKLFWEKKLWNFEKLKKKHFDRFDTKGSPLWEKKLKK